MNRPGCSITINPQKTQGAILQTWRHFPGPHETKVYQNTLGSCSQIISKTNFLHSLQPDSIGSDGVRLPTFPPQPQHHLMYIFSRESLANWLAKSPTKSCHGNPTPMESVCRHFPPSHTTWCKFSKSLANWLAKKPMESCNGNPSPSDAMESVWWHFPPQPQHHSDVYLLTLSRTDLR